MKIYSLLPFLGRDEVDKYLDKIISGEITGVSIAPFLPFASQSKISEVFLSEYRKGNLKSSKLSHFFPFINEAALHEIVVDYCENGGEPVPSSIVPFLSRQDIKLLFEYQLAHPERTTNTNADTAEDIAQTISDSISGIFTNRNWNDEGEKATLEEEISRTINKAFGGIFSGANKTHATSASKQATENTTTARSNWQFDVDDDDDEEVEEAQEHFEDAIEEIEDALDELDDAFATLNKGDIPEDARAKLKEIKKRLDEKLGNDD